MSSLVPSWDQFVKRWCLSPADVVELQDLSTEDEYKNFGMEVLELDPLDAESFALDILDGKD